jgi:hypothetical protein
MASQLRMDTQVENRPEHSFRFSSPHSRDAIRPADRCRSDGREEVIRPIFGNRGLARLPKVGRDSLTTYYNFLARQLLFPFEARVCEEESPLKSVDHIVLVTGLVDPRKIPIDVRSGLLSTVRLGGSEREMPLAELELEAATDNQRLIEDYWYWFWNWR